MGQPPKSQESTSNEEPPKPAVTDTAEIGDPIGAQPIEQGASTNVDHQNQNQGAVGNDAKLEPKDAQNTEPLLSTGAKEVSPPMPFDRARHTAPFEPRASLLGTPLESEHSCNRPAPTRAREDRAMKCSLRPTIQAEKVLRTSFGRDT